MYHVIYILITITAVLTGKFIVFIIYALQTILT